MDSDTLKQRAAERALDFVSPGMRLGLGTGSTAAMFVDLVGAQVKDGLDIVCVPTSEATRQQAEGLGIPLTTLDETEELDLTVDGADEFDGKLQLIKGGGGALLREKIVAASSARMVVIADESKRVGTLGVFPLPVEVVRFAWPATRNKIKKAAASLGCKGEIVLRERQGNAFVTDSGNHILDCRFGQIPDAKNLAAALSAIPGVVEHGLFIDIAKTAIVAGSNGVETIGEGP